MRLKTLPVVKSCSISYVSSFPYHFCTFCILHLLLTQYKLYNGCRVKAIFFILHYWFGTNILCNYWFYASQTSFFTACIASLTGGSASTINVIAASSPI